MEWSSSTNPSIWIRNVEVIPHISIKVHMVKGLHTCSIRTSKRIGTKCDTRSFSNFDALQHPNSAFPDRCSFLNNDQFAVLHNILSVVGVFFWGGTLYIQVLKRVEYFER